MNWSRARSVLIVIFLALNLVLCYYNFYRPYAIMEARMGGDEALQAVREKLLEEKITLLQPVPRQIIKAGHLSLLADTEKEDLLDTLLNKGKTEYTKIEMPDGRSFYLLDEGEVRIVVSACGLITYEDYSVGVTAESPLVSYDFARSVAEEFVKEIGCSLFGYRLQTQFSDHQLAESQTLVWCRNYGGHAVYDASLEVTVVGDRVRRCIITPYRVVGESTASLWVATAADILLRLPEDEYIRQLRDQALAAGENWLVVKEIEFGYFSFYAADALAEAMPVWRVLLENNRFVYFDALTAQRLFYI